ncbi:MAG: AEC family transporter [Leptolyngbyaceae cyanobacterium bins.302]|nr:AEC family transporter [Leptolyngbyaceae cyanobacterium bins.302]
MPIAKLLEIYLPLFGWTGMGWFLGRWFPAAVPYYLGRFLFWVGVPLGIVAFLRHAQVSWSLWLAPVVAWVAVLLGFGLAKLYLRWQDSGWSDRTQTSFLLTSMVGNTGYIGFPVSLVLVGSKYFAWAVFYDMIGSTPGAYGLGVALASQPNSLQTSDSAAKPGFNWRALGRSLGLNPAFWGFAIGLLGRDLPLPVWLEVGLRTIAWVVVSLALILVGIRLSQVKSLKNVKFASVSLAIKMLVVPLLVGIGLRSLGITGDIHRVIVLQMAMPPAFATLVIAEAYELDQNATVTTIAIGSLLLIATLPFWLWIFP